MSDVEELRAHLQNIARRAGDPRPAFREAGRIWRQAAVEHFESEGGGQWQRWDDRYARMPHDWRGPGDFMLRRTGELFASLTDVSHHQNVKRITETSLTIGGTRPTAILMHHGRGQSMPARTPMPQPELFEDAWVNTYKRRITGEDAGGLGA